MVNRLGSASLESCAGDLANGVNCIAYDVMIGTSCRLRSDKNYIGRPTEDGTV